MTTQPDPGGGPAGAADADGAADGVRRPITETWTEVFADAGGLVRAEAALARLETAENIRGFGAGAARIGAGALLVALSLTFLAVAAVVALGTLIGVHWALLAVALGCGLAGGLLLRGGADRLGRQTLIPERTLRRVARDLERLSERADPIELQPSAAGGDRLKETRVEAPAG